MLNNLTNWSIIGRYILVMGLSKLFYRIARPKAFIPDKRYASDRLQLGRAYINIEKELRSIFNFIEPDGKNKNAFSFELYSLLLRACTEVELNCKQIMEANGATPQGRFFTMADYTKLEKSSLLSKYTVIFPNWRQRNLTSQQLEYIRKKGCPFVNFDTSIGKSPDWYEAYNKVKHNQEENLEMASLENCINAVAGVLILLYSQFGSRCIETYGTRGLSWQGMDDYDLNFDADIIFDIYPPKISDWSSSELYDFEWNNIKTNSNPFDKFSFT